MVNSIENLHVGEYVALTDCFIIPENVIMTFSGAPLKITGISPPFVVYEGLLSGKRDTIDMRDYEVTKLSDEYVNAHSHSHKPEVSHRCPICNEGTFVKTFTYHMCKVCGAVCKRDKLIDKTAS